MTNDINITEDIKYVGVSDPDIELFEHQYTVPDGVTYNSYVILDDKITIMDSVDKKASKQWIENIEKVLEGKEPEYLVISHIEPDHAGSVLDLVNRYPNIKLVGNNKTFPFLAQYFEIPNFEQRQVIVNENDTLNLGKHNLHFYMAPMVHWPEVMVSYDDESKTLFSADGFGSFGQINDETCWDFQAKRYYYNICGKYGIQVQALLKKLLAKDLEIQQILPLHGPVLKENIDFYITKYDTWSKYLPDKEDVCIFCDSIHGNTFKACEILEKDLKEKGISVNLIDLAKTDVADNIAHAFESPVLIFASSTFNMNLFVHMDQLLKLLKDKNLQNKKIGIIENGTWSPNSAKCMDEIFSQMKGIDKISEPITIRGSVNDETIEKIHELANVIQKEMKGK